MTRVVDVSYRTPQMCKLVGLSYRQLDYWARTDLLRPSISEARGSGTQRRYSEADVAKARVIKSLLDVGVSVQRARSAVPLVGDAIAEGLRFLVVGGAPMACSDGELERVLREARVAVVVDLEAHP